MGTPFLCSLKIKTVGGNVKIFDLFVERNAFRLFDNNRPSKMHLTLFTNKKAPRGVLFLHLFNIEIIFIYNNLNFIARGNLAFEHFFSYHILDL